MKTKRSRLIIAVILLIAVIAGIRAAYINTRPAGTWTYYPHHIPRFFMYDEGSDGTLRNNGTAWELTVKRDGQNLTVIHSHSGLFSQPSAIPLADPVNDGYAITAIDEFAFDGFPYSRRRGLTDVTIPDSVTSIGRHAFECCVLLTNVTISGSVTNIGNAAFVGCTALTRVTIHDGVASIGSFAFYVCTNLPRVTIPGSVTSIGDYAFGNCSSLTSVTILGSVTNIGDNAFRECAKLTSVTFNGACPGMKDKPIYEGTPSATSYIHHAHATSWAPQLDSGSFAEGTAVWRGRPIRLASAP